MKISIFNHKLLNSQEAKFISYAIVVWTITQISLQTLLLFCPINISTFLSQLIYLVLGFKLYSQKVFNSSKNKNKNKINFLLMSIFLWIINNNGISFLNIFLKNKNFSAALMIPVLAFFSFIIQKNLIFK